MHTLHQSVHEIKEKLKGWPGTLVAVTKTHPLELLEEAYSIGLRDFGENKVQELTGKAEALPKDIRWHMIGHLQSNKVKYIAPFVHLIHTIDSENLIKEINKQGLVHNRVIDGLLQIHIAEEEHKFGLSPEDLHALLTQNVLSHYPMLRIKGLMGMATFTDEEDQIRREFAGLHALWEECKTNYPEASHWDTLSMGMSGDYPIAISEGSTHIRVGSAIFGERNYLTK
jgi:pyridoxal phosphate enzyme (YggS family)